MKVFNILIAGVGGQGVLLTSKIIAEAALLQGLDVKQSEVHGMAQLGGSVLSQVRFGDKVFSPIIAEGEADLLIGFEPLETARYLHFLRDGGIVVYNIHPIGTIGVSIGKETYPQDIHETIRKHATDVHPFDATKVAVEVGEKRAVNLVLLGAALRFLPLDPSVVDNAITKAVPKKLLELNRKAFLAGRSQAR